MQEGIEKQRLDNMNQCNAFPIVAFTDEFRDFMQHGCNLRVTHTHHIWGGTRRINRKANLIRVCKTVHEFIHANPDKGRVACLLAKLRNGCLDLDILDECAGRSTAGWLESRDFEGSWHQWKGEILKWASKH